MSASAVPTHSLAHLPAVHEIRVPSSVFARLAPHTVTEARERPLEHQTSVFSAIPCNQLITTWIPDPHTARLLA